MSTKDSRDVLDWFRAYSADALAAIGRDVSNLNVALTSDVRVRAALDYVLSIEADVMAAWTPAADALWESTQNTVWADITATMPADISSKWAVMWGDSDPNVRTLLKAITRTVSLATTLFNAGG